MEAAVVIPENLSGKTLKIVTRDFRNLSLFGKKYNDNTPIITIIQDCINALGGEYDEIDNNN